MQQEPELVGHEGVATQSIREVVILEILDPVLRLAPVDIGVVDGRRWDLDGLIDDDEASVGSFRQCLGLVDHASCRRPTHRLVRCLADQSQHLAVRSRLGECRLQQRCGEVLNPIVGDLSDRVGELVCLTEAVQPPGLRSHYRCAARSRR